MAGQKAFLCGGRCTHFTPAQFWQDFTLTPQRFAANYTPCVKNRKPQAAAEWLNQR